MGMGVEAILGFLLLFLHLPNKVFAALSDPLLLLFLVDILGVSGLECLGELVDSCHELIWLQLVLPVAVYILGSGTKRRGQGRYSLLCFAPKKIQP